MHQAAGRIESNGGSSDQESQDRGDDSSSHHSHLEDADDGESMGVDEDDDLDGKDATALQDVFDREVRSMTDFALNAV